MQGNNATESMSQARLPRHVYDPSMETDCPCLLPRALLRFSPHKCMEAARSCTFCTPARSVVSHLEFVLPRVLHSSTPRLPNGRKRNRQFAGQDHKLIAILFVAENERDEKAVPDVLRRHDAILGT